jgi:hypothetical protein
MKMPSFLRKGGFKPGAVEDFAAGSVDRAKAVTVRLVSSWSMLSTTRESWAVCLSLARKESAAELLGFEDFDAYLLASIGQTEKESGKRFEAKPTKQGERSDIGTVPKLSQSRFAKPRAE